MSTPSGKPPSPIDLSAYVSHKARERAATERYPSEDGNDQLRSPYAPKRAHERPAAERQSLDVAERQSLDAAERQRLDAAERYGFGAAEGHHLDSAEQHGFDSAERQAFDAAERQAIERDESHLYPDD